MPSPLPRVLGDARSRHQVRVWTLHPGLAHMLTPPLSSASPVLVTREAGKNGPLVKRLASAGIQARAFTAVYHATVHSP